MTRRWLWIGSRRWARLLPICGPACRLAQISAAFHDGLAMAIAEVAVRSGERTVALTGGCFQNARLTESTVAALRAAGLDPVWHRRVPPNDGGLALGQAAWAAWIEKSGESKCA